MRRSRRQRTFYIDGVRVRLNWSDTTGRGRCKVTDPGGDYAKEQTVLASVAGSFAAVMVQEGFGVNIGPVRVIRDHDEPA